MNQVTIGKAMHKAVSVKLKVLWRSEKAEDGRNVKYVSGKATRN